MQAKIITIGDELLIGQVIDSNSAWMGAELEKINVTVTEIRSIQDDEDVIKATLAQMLPETDVILISGGLGPTKDDVTKKALANFLGVPLEFKPEILEWIEQLFKKFSIPLKETHKTQAYIPQGSKIITNKMGTAQGMWMEYEGKIIVSMPGVPYEMKYIMSHGVLEKLLLRNTNGKTFHRTIMTAGWGETMIEEKISSLLDNLPKHIKVAYLPSLGKVRVRVSSTIGDEQQVSSLVEQIVKSLGEIVYGYDEEQLQSNIGLLLKERNLTLGTAESCTGGTVAHMITSVPGSSAYFQGSIIAYANRIKEKQLGVKNETLMQHGAVSEQTVKEMVAGAIENLGVDIGIATSGIAGPGGGTEEKPVGTIWIAVGNSEDVVTRKLQLTKNREKNIEYTSFAVLNMLRKFLLRR